MKKVSHKKVYLQTLSLAVLGMFAITHTASAAELDFGFSNTLTNAGNAAASGIKTAAGQVNLTKAAVTAIKGGGTTQLKAAGGALAKAATMGAASSAINSVVGTNVMSANGSISTGAVKNVIANSSFVKNIGENLGLGSGVASTAVTGLVGAALSGGNLTQVAKGLANKAVLAAKSAVMNQVNGLKDSAIAMAKDQANKLKNQALDAGKTAMKSAYASYVEGKSLGDVASTFSTGLSNGLSVPSFSDSLSLGNVANTVSSGAMANIGSSLSSLTSGSSGISNLVSGSSLGGLFGGSKASTAIWKTS